MPKWKFFPCKGNLQINQSKFEFLELYAREYCVLYLVFKFIAEIS
jgi:hypothetical protein